jgi:carboxymethylenebutenolidase
MGEHVDLSGRTAVPGTSTRLRGYVARPSTPGPWPGVVVVHEAWGLDDVARRQADRLAAAGYLVLLPDLYSDGGALRCLKATFAALKAQRGRAFQDIEASRAWLAGQGECTGRVGVIGFCMGGGFALLAATRGFQASSVNYGMLPEDADAALEGACPIVGSYGARDRGLKGAAATLGATLSWLGVEHDVKEYPTANHSFLNDAPNGPLVLRPLLKVAGIGPDPVAAADAWQRIEGFFARHLRGQD